MIPKASFYQEQLYPLQDTVLSVLNPLDTGFYLTGGTAVSRVYCQHRFSDDLDFFVNDSPHFALWGERIIFALTQLPDWQCTVDLRDDRFIRLTVKHDAIWLKIELINDVPSHIGKIWTHPILGNVDSAENLLANKLTAVLDRQEPKDLADIWALTQIQHISIMASISNAQSKAAGIFPLALARVLLKATEADWQAIRWQNAPSIDRFLTDLHQLGKSLILE
jgi:hypothetical protein